MNKAYLIVFTIIKDEVISLLFFNGYDTNIVIPKFNITNYHGDIADKLIEHVNDNIKKFNSSIVLTKNNCKIVNMYI